MTRETDPAVARALRLYRRLHTLPRGTRPPDQWLLLNQRIIRALATMTPAQQRAYYAGIIAVRRAASDPPAQREPV